MSRFPKKTAFIFFLLTVLEALLLTTPLGDALRAQQVPVGLLVQSGVALMLAFGGYAAWVDLRNSLTARRSRRRAARAHARYLTMTGRPRRPLRMKE